MTDLQCYDEEALRAELERREREKKARAIPQPLASPDWARVTEYCHSYVDQKAKQGWVNDDLKQYIFEAALEAVFGKNVWPWINAR